MNRCSHHASLIRLIYRQKPSRRAGGRAGFTLIEMLVSAALTVLIMSLFAEIFALATGSIADQRTIARHDQKVRVLTQTIQNDLAGRTFRQRSDAVGLSRGIVPLFSNSIPDSFQSGYFYYSENDPGSNFDDVLQFTTEFGRNREEHGFVVDNNAPTAFIGRATLIGAGVDEPVSDDGNIANGQTTSSAAEVSYFLRGGNLYRRVLLLRDAQGATREDEQPADAAGNILLGASRVVDDGVPNQLLPSNYNGGVWYNNFDVAAVRYDFDPEADGPFDGDGDGVGDDDFDVDAEGDGSAIYVHSLRSLNNRTGDRCLGLPWNRFGHFPFADRDLVAPAGDEVVLGATNSQVGHPYEFLRGSGNFVGRFTLGEMSATAFNYPSSNSTIAAHPFHRDDLTTDTNAQVAVYANGPRTGEDLIMGNVVGFDVKIWDDALGRFVDLGQASSAGAQADGGLYTDNQPGVAGFQSASLANNVYGPNAVGLNRVFDTWHPDAGDQPPILVSQAQLANASSNALPPGIPGPTALPDMDKNAVGNRYEGVWDTENHYSTGDIVTPDVTIPPYANPTIITPPTTLVGQFFRATVNDRDGGGAAPFVRVSNVQPDWREALTYGSVVQNSFDGSGDNIIWNPVENDAIDLIDGDAANNYVGLKKLQIVITIRDPQTNAIRDLTLVHSFVE